MLLSFVNSVRYVLFSAFFSNVISFFPPSSLFAEFAGQWSLFFLSFLHSTLISSLSVIFCKITIFTIFCTLNCRFQSDPNLRPGVLIFQIQILEHFSREFRFSCFFWPLGLFFLAVFLYFFFSENFLFLFLLPQLVLF